MTPADQPIRRISFGDRAEAFEFASAETLFDRERGYGWTTTGGRRNVIREESPDPLLRSFVLGKGKGAFRLSLPQGLYTLVVHFGDPKGVARAGLVAVTGGSKPSVVKTSGREAAILTKRAEGKRAYLDVTVTEPPGHENGWAIAAIEVFLGHEVQSLLVPAEVKPRSDLWALPAETESGPRATLKRWRMDVAGIAPPVPTGSTAAQYLELISGCVDHFKGHQDGRGAIIDPHRGMEFQYATPCYAYAAALLVRHAARTDLIESAFTAYSFAAIALGTRTAADGHEDFYASPLAHAYALFSGLHFRSGLTDAEAAKVETTATGAAPGPTKALIPRRRLEQATAPLSDMKARSTYRKPPGGRKRSGANWNCKALAGHWLLVHYGIQQDDGYVADSLLRQGQWFDNEHGLYAEGPATYDIFPRAWLADMLAHGYAGPGSAVLTEALDRGAISSLFMQSPTGELATGGRSSQHLWSDALQCVTFEWAAGRALAAKEVELAGVFKRAARRALLAIYQWRRPSGEFWIVKNHAPPEHRFGYEVYSSHSQYNLLTATALGYAFELAQASEAAIEAWTPAERGRSSFVAGPGLDRAFATAEGTQVEVALAPVPLQTPRGIIRVQMKGLPPQLPMTDAVPAIAMFHLPNPIGPAIALGPAWLSAEGTSRDLMERPIVSLAELDRQSVSTSLVRATRTAGGSFMAIHHAISQPGAPKEITEAVEIESNAVTITWSWSSFNESLLMLRVPLFAHDGENASQICGTDDGAAIRLAWQGREVRFERVGPGEPFRLDDRRFPFRCGWFCVAELPVTRQRASLRLVSSSIKAS